MNAPPLGVKTSTYVYTLFAFFMNALHARFDPRGPAKMAAFALVFAIARTWISGCVLASRVALFVRPAKRPPPPPAARTPVSQPAPPGEGADADAGVPA